MVWIEFWKLLLVGHFGKILAMPYLPSPIGQQLAHEAAEKNYSCPCSPSAFLASCGESRATYMQLDIIQQPTCQYHHFASANAIQHAGLPSIKPANFARTGPSWYSRLDAQPERCLPTDFYFDCKPTYSRRMSASDNTKSKRTIYCMEDERSVRLKKYPSFW